MKTNFIKSLVALAGFLFAGGNTAMVAKETPVTTRSVEITKGFKGVIAQQAIEITYTENTEPSKAVITGPANDVDDIEWSVNRDGMLTFKYRTKKNFRKKVTVKLNGGLLASYDANSSGSLIVTTPVDSKDVINVAASSNGEIIFNGDVDAKVANISVSSNAKIKPAVINCSSLNVAASSNGTFKANRVNVGKINLAVSSGADTFISGCSSKTLNVSASSGGDVSVKNAITEDANVTASSGASITIAGKAQTVRANASSGGDINMKGLAIDSLSSKQTSSGGNISL